MNNPHEIARGLSEGERKALLWLCTPGGDDWSEDIEDTHDLEDKALASCVAAVLRGEGEENGR